MSEDLDKALVAHLRAHPGLTIKALAEVFTQVHVNTLRNRIRKLVDTAKLVEHGTARERRYAVAATEVSVPVVDRPAEPEPPLPFDVHRNLTKDEQAAAADPIRRTANFMHAHLRVGSAPQYLAQARALLLNENAREVFVRCLNSLAEAAKKGPTGAQARAVERALSSLQRSLGISREHLKVPARGSLAGIHYDEKAVAAHVEQRVSAGNFLFEVHGTALGTDDGSLRVGGSDVSQHWGVVTLPRLDNLLKMRVAFPIVVHNAAVVVKVGAKHQRLNNDQPWKTYFVPKLVEDCREWMLIDSETLYEYDDNRRKRLCMSSMDIGQYYIETEQMMKGDFQPQVLFREGRIFPNDCFLSNAVDTDNTTDRHSAYVREAVRRMNSFLDETKKNDTLVCGVAKTTTASCFGPVLDWYIREYIDKEWVFQEPWPADNIWMTHLLADSDFDGSFRRTLVSCGVQRTFRDVSDVSPTRNGENADKAEVRALEALSDAVSPQTAEAYRRALDTPIVMFFVGHARRAEMRLPRYEYHQWDSLEQHPEQARRILAAIRFSGLATGTDVDAMTSETLNTLVPSVVIFAQDHSKAVGERLALDVKQEILGAFKHLTDDADRRQTGDSNPSE